TKEDRLPVVRPPRALLGVHEQSEGVSCPHAFDANARQGIGHALTQQCIAGSSAFGVALGASFLSLLGERGNLLLQLLELRTRRGLRRPAALRFRALTRLRCVALGLRFAFGEERGQLVAEL